MSKLFTLCVCVLILSSCTVYTEKQSEALSQAVHATKDSLDQARIDLADRYAEQATRIVKSPKKRIEVKAIYKKTIDVLDSSSKHTKVPVNKQRIAIIPEKYKNDTVVVVTSEEYQQLLKDKEIFAQIEKDNQSLLETKKLVDEELLRQMEYNDKMIRDLNLMQKQLIEKDLAILKRNIIIVVLCLFIGGATYLRIKGIL